MLRFRSRAVLLIICIWLNAATASPAAAQPSRSVRPPEDVPPLSVETLYHPKSRYQYVKSTAPTTRWTKDETGAALLLIKRRGGWMQLDPAAALPSDQPPNSPESPQPAAESDDTAPPESLDQVERLWPGAELLTNQLISLGVQPQKAAAAVSSWIGTGSRSLDRALVEIDKGLILAGLKQTPRWITRQAGRWDDPTLSPDGQRVAFVQKNDLYVMDLRTDRLMRITDDGSDTRLNGRLDWVYQEEVFGRGTFKAFWWSEDSRTLAFLRLENSHVRPFTITTGSTPQGETFVERYPKAGDPITAAELWATRLTDDHASAFSLVPVYAPPADLEMLIVRVGWRPGSRELIYEVTNRLQNELTLWRYDLDAAGEVKPTVIMHERSDQWLELLELPHWLPSGDFLWLSDLPSGRRRLWRISGDGRSRVPLTPADFDVRELVAVDAVAGTAYLTGDLRRGTVGQQLYLVDVSSANEPASPLIRATFELPWHRVSFSDDKCWMIDRAGSLTQPTKTSLRRCDGRADDASPLLLLHTEELRFPGEPIEPQWSTIQTADGIELPGYLFPPRGAADESDDPKKFPVLMEVYGGPLSPTVRDSWAAPRYLFHQMLADQGIGVLVVDNRSSGGRGLADAWAIHRRVGELETKDMLAAVEWLKTQDWVNADRIAIRGWSFGGFLTLHAMTHSDAFAAGIAGGSVSDWRNYDAIYTERYMGLPAENVAGYDATSPRKAAAKLKGRVLMIHGEVDDNVHLANTMQMADALQQAGITFDMMIYPGAAHSVHGAMPVYHLMQTTVDFLKRELLQR
jgi:dipeptidyl-peptidase 4